jgi:hypothetical protein
VVVTEGELKLAPRIELQDTQELNRDAHLPNLRKCTGAVPHHWLGDHALNLAYLLDIVDPLVIIATQAGDTTGLRRSSARVAMIPRRPDAQKRRPPPI